MTRLRHTTGLWPSLLLATLLVAAQFGAALHAFAHDIGAPQGKVCATCTAASQLGTACVDTAPAEVPDAPQVQLRPSVAPDYRFTTTTTPRQRGPPAIS